jgi:hypothetical protein
MMWAALWGSVVQVDGERLIGDVDGHGLTDVFSAEPGPLATDTDPAGVGDAPLDGDRVGAQ